MDAGTGKEGELSACLAIDIEGPAGTTYEEGCADVGATLNLDPEDLSAASLAPTSVDLLINEEYSKTVSLAAVWTAVGPTEKHTSNVVDHQINCRIQYHISGLFQPAAITISLDGHGHEGDGNLQVVEQTRRTVFRQS